jgi:PTS system mannose-specific IIA component
LIGVLLLTHGGLAAGYASALELITGHCENFDYLGLYHETSIEDYRVASANKIRDLDQGQGVLVFCDILGASPYNVTAQNYKLLKDTNEYRAITGVNLPMLIEALYCRETMALDELATHIQEIGKEGVKELFQIAKERNDI